MRVGREPPGSGDIALTRSDFSADAAPSKMTCPEIVFPGLVVMTRSVMSWPPDVIGTDADSSSPGRGETSIEMLAGRHVGGTEPSIRPAIASMRIDMLPRIACGG